MTAYVIALQPEKKLKEKIKRLKKEAEKIVGKQQYLADEPHLTLYILKTKKEIVDAFMNEISRKIKKISLTVTNWIIFKNDQITGKQTLACTFAEQKKLRALQKKVITGLNNYRTAPVISRYEKVKKTLGKKEQENLKHYGYPFVGEHWIAHVSIASFEKKAFDKIWKKMKEQCPKGAYESNNLKVYELDENTESLKTVKEYPLA